MPSPFPNMSPERRGEVHRLWFDAERLRANPWGDPSARDLIVYTPPGWTTGETLPAVFLLSGFAGTGEGMLGRGLGDVSIATRIDHLVADGCPRFLAVLPDCMTRVGGSQFVDSPAIGPYLSYLLDDVRPLVDARFHTSGSWGAAGRSSGGFGAFNLAVAAPRHIRAIACHAGDMGFDLAYLSDLPAAIRGIQQNGGLEGFHDRFWAKQRPGRDDFAAFNILAMACAYSPAPGAKPFPATLPFDPQTGEIHFDVLQAWRAFDPIVRASEPSVQAALRSLALLFIDAGGQDEYSLHLGARRLVTVLEAGGVPHAYEEFAGGHRGTAWRYDVSLPKIAAALHR